MRIIISDNFKTRKDNLHNNLFLWCRVLNKYYDRSLNVNYLCECDKYLKMQKLCILHYMQVEKIYKGGK